MSTSKEAKRLVGRVCARFAFYFFSWLLRTMPYPALKAISGGLLTMVYYGVWYMRKAAMGTLSIAFGKEKSDAELKKICKACFYNAGRGALEVGAFTAHLPLLMGNFSFAGNSRENLDAALKEGRGVIGISAHFGNFPLMMFYLAQLGYPINAIIRPSRDMVIEKDFQDWRTNLGLKTVYSYPREACVAQSLKALRNKELLMIFLNQNTGSKSGVYVDFFGQKAGTATGPVIFAMRTGAPLLPIFTLRNGDSDTHTVVIEKHFFLEQKATDEETVQYNVQKLTNIIEGYIRKYPTEWGWMHRRWKSRPKTAAPQEQAKINA